MKKERSNMGFKSLRKSLSKEHHQTGTSNKKRDASRKAFGTGKRVSRTGKVYWESRKNRSDMPDSTI